MTTASTTDVLNGEKGRRLGVLAGSFGISLVVHVLLIGLFGLATWAIHASVNEEPVDYQVQAVVAEPPIGLTGGFKFPGQAGIDRPDSGGAGPDSTKPSLQFERAVSNQTNEPPSPAIPTDGGLAGATRSDSFRSEFVGLAGSGTGSGSGVGSGEGEFSGGGPVGTMWGVGQGQNARSVVYVMDRSGSMIDTFTMLQRELMRAVGSLNQEQLFNVIWFNEGRATELFPRMKSATLDNKRDAFDAIKTIVPSGQTQPIDAVRRALAYKPDVLFLLSDGDFGDENKKIIQTIKQMNTGRKTKINTILFVYDTLGEGERVLREIAESNRGTYKHVTEEDVKQ